MFYMLNPTSMKASDGVSSGVFWSTRYSLNEKYRVVNDVFDRVLDRLVDDM